RMYVEEAHKDERGQYVNEGSVYSIPYRPKSFGAVISLESLDTVEDQKRALEEIYRVSDYKALLVHIAKLLPNPETCKKILKKEGIKVFSDYFIGPGGRVLESCSYSLDRKKEAKFLALRQELEELKRRDSQDAGIDYDEWSYFPDRVIRDGEKIYSWSEEAKTKHQEVMAYRDKHMQVINKEAYRDILKRKSKGLFTFVEEYEKNGINFYVFRKIKTRRHRNIEL
ncbi:methyltransferase domain-containing protein, partial [Candidatus Omnitrophota bacterium]